MKRKVKKILIAAMVIIIGGYWIYSYIQKRNPEKKFIVERSYTPITDDYYYVRIDSLLTGKHPRLSIDEDKFENVRKYENGKFTKKKYKIPYNTYFKVFRSSEKIDDIDSLLKRGTEIYGVVTTYKHSKEWNLYYPTWESRVEYNKIVGEKKIKNPFFKVMDEFICFSGENFNKAIIIRIGEDTVYKKISNPYACLKSINPYDDKYFFLEGESLMILDKSMYPIDTILHMRIAMLCDDNSQFLFLGKNDDSRFVIYDMKNFQIVNDKRSNSESNILLENQSVNTYTEFTNEDEFEGTNKLKVGFTNHGKKVYSLLNETTMTHCSEILYENILPFDEQYVMGILQPQNVHNVIFTDANGNITGSIGSASGHISGVSIGGQIGGSFEYRGDVNLKTSSKQTLREKDNYKIGILISKKTGKEVDIVYQVFDDGQKVKIR